MRVVTGLLQPFGHGLGFPDWIDVTSPAAGAAASYTVTGDNYVRVLAARASITTDSNTANRIVSLDFVNARSVTYCRNAAAVVVTASTTNQAFEWQYGRGTSEWNTNTPVFAPIMLAPLAPGFTVKFSVDNVQVGDQLSGLKLWVEKFLTGPDGYSTGVNFTDQE